MYFVRTFGEFNYQFSSYSKMQYKIYHKHADGVRIPLCQNSNYNFRSSVMSLFCSFIILKLFSYFITAKNENSENKCETKWYSQQSSRIRHYFRCSCSIENTQKLETQQLPSRSSKWIEKCRAKSFWQHQRHHRWPPMPQIGRRSTLMHWRKTQIWNAVRCHTTDSVCVFAFFAICLCFRYSSVTVRIEWPWHQWFSMLFWCTSTWCVALDEGLFDMSHMMSHGIDHLMYDDSCIYVQRSFEPTMCHPLEGYAMMPYAV